MSDVLAPWLSGSHSPLVSVVINNHNYGRFLPAAIDSVLDQTYAASNPHRIEIIVVDDGSTDDSHEVIARYGAKVIPVLKANGGQDSAFNAGFAQSRGEIICLLDADDRFISTKVEQIVRCFQNQADIGWCFHSLLLEDAHTHQPICTTRAFPGRGIDTSRRCDFRQRLRLGSLPFYPTSTSGLCFRRSLLQRILPMPETFIATSADRYVRLVAMGLSPGYFLARELTVQGIHGSNVSTLRRDRPSIPERQIVVAYLLRTQFPEFSRYANRLFVRGLTAYKSLKAGTVEPEYVGVIRAYWRLCLPIEYATIALMRLYRRRPWRQAMHKEADYYYFAPPKEQAVAKREKVPAVR